MTQGDPISSTIFNVVVYSVVRHWESLVVEGGGDNDRYNSSGDEATQPARRTIRARNDGHRRTEGGHMRLKVKAEFFYADGGMLASTEPVWLQTTFDTLVELFDRVVLKTNVQKTVGKVCHP